EGAGRGGGCLAAHAVPVEADLPGVDVEGVEPSQGLLAETGQDVGFDVPGVVVAGGVLDVLGRIPAVHPVDEEDVAGLGVLPQVAADVGLDLFGETHGRGLGGEAFTVMAVTEAAFAAVSHDGAGAIVGGVAELVRFGGRHGVPSSGGRGTRGLVLADSKLRWRRFGALRFGCGPPRRSPPPLRWPHDRDLILGDWLPGRAASLGPPLRSVA